MKRSIEDLLDRAAHVISTARTVTVVTGAGVSAASGVPTFRGATDLWKSFRPEDLATPEAFARDPGTVWEWYQWRRSSIADCRPNQAHEVLAVWSRRYPRFHLITQNVDGLHERAGTADVTRFHGSIWDLQCAVACAGAPRTWSDHTVEFPRLPPPCPHCGGPARPGVVWFGEAIPAEAIIAAHRASLCDVCIVVGTSSQVYPAAGIVTAAGSRGATTIEINPETTALTRAMDISIALPAVDALDRIEWRM
jgi:NAD-dependent deacetylase